VKSASHIAYFTPVTQKIKFMKTINRHCVHSSRCPTLTSAHMLATLFVLYSFPQSHEVNDVTKEQNRTALFLFTSALLHTLQFFSHSHNILIPDGVIGIFHWHNPSGRTMALGLTQPLTEMSTMNISWGVKAAGT